MSNLNCPKCNSENTQRLSAIVDSGTSQSRSVSVGSFGGSFGGTAGFGTTSSSTNTTTQSTLAKKLAAPRKRATVLLLIGFGFLMLIAWGMFGKFLGLLAAAGIGYFAFIKYRKNCAFNADELPGLLDGWNRSFYCHRCENVFQI
jgi:hypothetical protein